MDQKGKELITNKTSLTTQPGGLASRGLQIANKLAAQNPKTVEQLIDEQYFTNSLGMEFRLIPAGTFTMGSPETEKGRYDNEKQHQVTITKPFWIGITQVTQSQYERVIGNNPSYHQREVVGGDSSNHPVEEISWEEAVRYCRRISELSEIRKGKCIYRLPTEAEWEYSCRAGATTTFCFGEDEVLLPEYAWIKSNSDGKTHPVGQKKPNNWGLRDMHGNVLEYCSDFFRNKYPGKHTVDPTGPKNGYGPKNDHFRLIRGGRRNSDAGQCRSSRRIGVAGPGNYSIGFRVAMDFGQRP